MIWSPDHWRLWVAFKAFPSGVSSATAPRATQKCDSVADYSGSNCYLWLPRPEGWLIAPPEVSDFILLLVRIELTTSPLPKQCTYARAIILLALASREVQIFAVCSGVSSELSR